jgi:hypothetical protein
MTKQYETEILNIAINVNYAIIRGTLDRHRSLRWQREPDNSSPPVVEGVASGVALDGSNYHRSFSMVKPAQA